jgi:hypothetical protein
MPEKTSYSGDVSHAEKMYCVKCRLHVIISAPELVKLANGRYALRGKCPHDKTICYLLISNDRAQKLKVSREG